MRINGVTNHARDVVCKYSWAKHFADKKAPIEEGSQADHSAMMSTVSKVVSL